MYYKWLSYVEQGGTYVRGNIILDKMFNILYCSNSAYIVKLQNVQYYLLFMT